MTSILPDQHFGELGRVGQVAVVRQAYAVGRIHVKGLRLGSAVAAGGRITHVADALVTLQREHVLLFEYIAHQTRALARAQPAFRRTHDTGGILAAMLQDRQRIVEALVDGTGADDTDDAAHVCAKIPSDASIRRVGRVLDEYFTLTDHATQHIRGSLAVRYQRRTVPPWLPVQSQRMTQHHKQTDHHHAAQKAEDAAEEAVGATEYRQPYDMPGECANASADEHDPQKDDGARGPGAHVLGRQRPAQVRLEHIGVVPGDPDRGDPCQQRDHL